MRQLKRICLVISITLLLSGCVFAPSVDSGPSTIPSTAHSHDLLTQPQSGGDLFLTKMEEIENAWYAANNVMLGTWFTEDSEKSKDGVRYYGCYNGYDVIYCPSNGDGDIKIQVGNVVFSAHDSFSLYAYNSGNFYDLKQIYEEGWLTEESLQKIAGIHLQYQNKLYPILNRPVDNDEIFDLMKEAFLRQFVKEDGWSEKDLQVVYYGDYDGAHVGFINGIFQYTMAFCSETVGSHTFHYSTGQKLLVYFEGELMRLGEAYEKGILTDDALAQLHRTFQANTSNNTE